MSCYQYSEPWRAGHQAIVDYLPQMNSVFTFKHAALMNRFFNIEDPSISSLPSDSTIDQPTVSALETTNQPTIKSHLFGRFIRNFIGCLYSDPGFHLEKVWVIDREAADLAAQMAQDHSDTSIEVTSAWEPAWMNSIDAVSNGYDLIILQDPDGISVDLDHFFQTCSLSLRDGGHLEIQRVGSHESNWVQIFARYFDKLGKECHQIDADLVNPAWIESRPAASHDRGSPRGTLQLEV